MFGLGRLSVSSRIMPAKIRSARHADRPRTVNGAALAPLPALVSAILTTSVLAGVLAGCSATRYRPVSDYPVKIGRPYTVRGQVYTPADMPAYDVVGYASWYGGESGNQTANGERFRAKAITGAHPLLPLPSYVEVTALDTGRTILVRLNDRGPFTRNRVIDLSRGAARLLGTDGPGSSAVHVRRVDPPERDKDRLRKGKPAASRPDVPLAMLAAWRRRLALAPR